MSMNGISSKSGLHQTSVLISIVIVEVKTVLLKRMKRFGWMNNTKHMPLFVNLMMKLTQMNV